MGNPFPGNARLQPGPVVTEAGLEPGVPRSASRWWHSRGYMPHFDSPHVVQHVTFRLADSLPTGVLARLEEELRTVPPERQDAERRRQIEAWIDAGYGCCLLQEPTAGCLVQDALLFFDGARYRLLAWVVMPNHVHVLFQPLEGWAMARIVASWKSFTGRRLAPLLPTSLRANAVHRVWHREYWDRFIRDERHFYAARKYIHNNPVQAGLVQRPEEWEWSSARLKAGEPGGSRARLEPGDPRGKV
jgi:putative transposase